MLVAKILGLDLRIKVPIFFIKSNPTLSEQSTIGKGLYNTPWRQKHGLTHGNIFSLSPKKVFCLLTEYMVPWKLNTTWHTTHYHGIFWHPVKNMLKYLSMPKLPKRKLTLIGTHRPTIAQVTTVCQAQKHLYGTFSSHTHSDNTGLPLSNGSILNTRTCNTLVGSQPKEINTATGK